MNPAAPVSSTVAEPDAVAHSQTFQGACAAVPQLVQELELAVGVHGEEEALVPIGHELAVPREPLQRLLLEHAATIAIEVVEHAAARRRRSRR